MNESRIVADGPDRDRLSLTSRSSSRPSTTADQGRRTRGWWNGCSGFRMAWQSHKSVTASRKMVFSKELG